jgi:hypothetical protein
MKATFKISTNIERDSDLDLDYIVTKNSNEVYNRIIYNHAKGQNSFLIIGSYGTGKSSFLWAFQKHLEGKKILFDKPVNGEFKGIESFNFARIIGESKSFKEQFCIKFGLSNFLDCSNKEILKEFEKVYLEVANVQKGLVVIVDEFGKHLEYIAKYNPDEMYFIQELSEYCNNPEKQILFITTLHQNISAYSKGLSSVQKSEWDKVKGRLVDIAFDEPIEQLLFFASEKLKSIKKDFTLDKKFKKNIDNIIESNLIGKVNSEKKQLLEDLYPIDPLAADILTKSLQRYGQNERSLFTFLESVELTNAIKNNTFFTVDDCFDYLINNLSSEIEDSEKNPFKPQWKESILALEKCEFLFDENFESASKILKTICLVNIFSNSIGILDETFLIDYSFNFLNISDSKVILNTLDRNQIIKFSNHRNKFNFTEGTDVDIEFELVNASKFIDNSIKLVSRLKFEFNFDVIPAKRIQFKNGTPRFFDFQIWDEFNTVDPENEIDGYINLIFSNKIELSLIKEKSKKKNNQAQIFVLLKNTEIIEETLFEIDKVNYVISKHSEDKVAVRVLNEEKLFRKNKLEQYVRGALFSKDSIVNWVYNGKEITIDSEKDLNILLSEICETYYDQTPVFKNEMVNKENLSTPILTARKALLRQMIDNGDIEDLGIDITKFPPEKTIYLSLLKKSGIHRFSENAWTFNAPTDESFLSLWSQTEEILKRSIESKKTVSDFYKELKKPPFKLKKGFLEFWVPIFLIVKKEDYSLYSANGEYIPHITSEILDTLHKKPSEYLVKALSNDGVKENYLNVYKQLLDYNNSNVKGLQSSYITIYGNFLKFYRNLEEYSKKTRSIPVAAQGVRDAIANAKDPESALFETIPNALGYHNINFLEENKHQNNFLADLKESVKQIRKAYDDLVELIENTVLDYLQIKVKSFEKYKPILMKKFASINKDLIANDQIKIFFTRVISPLDIKKAYWESLTDAVIGKKLDKVTDEEIGVLLEKFKNNFENLINLLDLHQIETNNEQKVIQLKITHSDGNSDFKKNIIVSKESAKEIQSLEAKLEILLNNNSEINKIALLNLLEKELNKK